MTGPKPVALPLGYSPMIWGDRWGSNPRVPEPQSGALTTSPRSPYGRGSRIRTRSDGLGDRSFAIKLYPEKRTMVEGERVELPNPAGADVQSAELTHFAGRAIL